MENDRIKLEDSVMDMIMKVGEGNPGAISVMSQMIQEGARIDPQSFFGSFSGILSLDNHGIYADRIWMLYKDVCGESIVNTLAFLRAVQLGKLSEADMNKAIDNRGEGIDVDDILETVMNELENFNRD